jgi:uncharacterized protein with FMN-binding domain
VWSFDVSIVKGVNYQYPALEKGLAMNVLMKRSIPALMLVAAAFPTGSAWAAPHVTSKTYKGPTSNTQWGTIQVIIIVKSKKITGVTIASSPHTARSQFIQGQAFPLLRAEALTAQSANINVVSGATDISNAYIQSLQSAVSAARKAKNLK